MKLDTCNQYAPLHHLKFDNKVNFLLIFNLNDSKSHHAVIGMSLSFLDSSSHNKPKNTRSVYLVDDIKTKQNTKIV